MLIAPRKYGAILCDPPWRFETWSANGRDRCPDAPVTRNEQRQNKPERHYATMTLSDIMKLQVAEMSADDCVLFLWTVDPMLPRALEVGAAWGFTFKTVGFVWAKERRNRGANNRRTHVPLRPFPMGTGYWTRANPELCLLFTRGKPKRISAGVEKLIVAPRREHSRKPDETYDRIEQLVAGPYLELFARTERAGWDALGDGVGRWSADRTVAPSAPGTNDAQSRSVDFPQRLIASLTNWLCDTPGNCPTSATTRSTVVIGMRSLRIPSLPFVSALPGSIVIAPLFRSTSSHIESRARLSRSRGPAPGSSRGSPRRSNPSCSSSEQR